MNNIMGITLMVFGFISMAFERYGSATFCFGLAFILWCLIAIDEYKEYRKSKKGADNGKSDGV